MQIQIHKIHHDLNLGEANTFPLIIYSMLGHRCRNPTLGKCGVKPNTPKVGDLESFGTPECLEFDNKAQNTSH